MKEKKLNPESKIKTLASNHSAITLIALIITIIVMLILVAVTVTVAINGGLFSTAKKATTETQYQADREMLLSAVIGAINDNAEVDFTELDKNLPNGFIVTEDGLYTSKSGNTFYVNKTGNIIKPVTVTDGTETVMLTPKNVGEYLGKEVTNYKTNNNTTETITIDGTQYTVSTKYRLYYVDFENKYQDGVGTIYLKAECTENKYQLQKTEPKGTDVVKIKELNPELYKNGNPPNSDYDNMKAVTWLTNTNNWEGLKNGVDETVAKNINYIVGAPSLEMMMDSYNKHYGLEGNEADTKTDLKNISDARVKLLYTYPFGDWNSGYGVGPSNSFASGLGYGYWTASGTVKIDESIGDLYCPDTYCSYWLSSPESQGPTCIAFVNHGSDAVGSGSWDYEARFLANSFS